MSGIKQKTIFIANMISIAYFVGIRLLFTFVPTRAEELARAQEEYSENGESAADNRWAYFIINKDSPLPEDYECSLAPVQGQFLMDERCAGYAREMIAAAAEDGVELMVVSAYRSLQKQRENLEAYTQRLISEGHSPRDAEKLALEEIAEPGTSEHNAGLALDILTYDWWAEHDDVTAEFENSVEYLWLSANAHKYGFILRYPKDAEKVTGYTYEPWHYRFVGLHYANEIYRSGLPLEYYYITERPF